MPRYILLFSILEQIISQKNQEWFTNPCTIEFIIDSASKFCWIYVVPNDLKRVISNLMNNAYESLKHIRKIIISIHTEKQLIRLDISDSGTGIPQDKVMDVLNGKSLKHEGIGLGLSGAQLFIKEIGGELRLNSHINSGTNVTLMFPIINRPSWFPTEIIIKRNSMVLILDDDISIHSFWKDKLQSYDLVLQHFISSEHLMDWCNKQSNTNANCIYFIDNDLRYDERTGIEIIETLNLVKNVYLITNYGDEIKIQHSCDKLGISLIPKNIIGQITLREISNTDTVS